MSTSTISLSNSDSAINDDLLAQFDAHCKITVSENYHPDYEIYYKGINFLMRDNVFKNRHSGYWITDSYNNPIFDQEAFNEVFYGFFGQQSEYKYSIQQLGTIAQKRFQVSLDELRTYYEKKIEFFNSRNNSRNSY